MNAFEKERTRVNILVDSIPCVDDYGLHTIVKPTVILPLPRVVQMVNGFELNGELVQGERGPIEAVTYLEKLTGKTFEREINSYGPWTLEEMPRVFYGVNNYEELRIKHNLALIYTANSGVGVVLNCVFIGSDGQTFWAAHDCGAVLQQRLLAKVTPIGESN